jgi:hypothetical protein
VILFAIVTVEFGGWSLLGFLTSDDRLDSFQQQFFRAGHGHAGVLLILALAFVLLLEKSSYSVRTQVALAITLLFGILMQSGGFFLHVVVGEESSTSAGTYLTWAGAVLLAVALIGGGMGLLRGSGARTENAY